MLATTMIFAATVLLLVFVSADQRTITAKTGDDVTLPCRAGDDKNIKVVQWNRPDLEPEYVLCYRDGHLDPENQHPSFHNRVDLQDNDGNVSLILKNVTINDTGTYECRVFQRKPGERLAAIKSIISIHLEVSPAGRTQDGGDMAAGRTQDGGEKDAERRGHYGLIGSLSAFGILVLGGGVGFWIFKKKNSAPPPDMI